MRRMFRGIGRAPVRIVTSVFALALAVGAIGVFAIPEVASSSLRASVETDRLANLVLSTTDTGGVDLDAVVGDATNVAAH
jgi:putative ABC transport system permease protein